MQILTVFTRSTVKLASRGDPWTKPSENRTLQGSPREASFTVPQVKTVNICFITPHT